MASDELLLITQPALRTRLLQARLLDEGCKNTIIQRGEQVYLSLRGLSDEGKRYEVKWAILRLQMGAELTPTELPEPIRSALLATTHSPAPLLQSLIWGIFSSIFGGVLLMALVGLMMAILNVPTDSYVGITATAVTFVVGGIFIGLVVTVYAWQHISRKNSLLSQETS